MAQRFGVWERLWRSPWSAAAYRDVAAGRVGRMFGYLALLILFATAAVTIRVQCILAQGVHTFHESQWWKQHMPEIRIEKGKASSPAPQPFLYEWQGGAFLLDTTGATTALDSKYRQGILLTQDELVYRRSAQETRRYALKDCPDLVINQTTIERLLDALKTWAWLVVAVGTICWLWIAKLFQVLFWSLLCLIVNAVSGRSLRYGALFNIGVYALAVPLAFDLLTDGLGWRHWVLGWLSLALYAGYLIWGLLAQPSASAESPGPGSPSAA